MWTDNCQTSFEAIKDCLIQAPDLSSPDYSLSFVVQTDASSYGLGAVISQLDPNSERVICYISRSLSKVGRNYSTTERECLAVLFAVEKLKPYFEVGKITVATDHHFLLWLDRLKEPT